jgi:hypothetical protein
MGNDISTAMNVMKAKNAVTGGGGDNEKDAAKSQEKSKEATEKQLALAERSKNQQAEYNAKKAVHAEKKKKLSEQWAANKAANK